MLCVESLDLLEIPTLFSQLVGAVVEVVLTLVQLSGSWGRWHDDGSEEEKGKAQTSMEWSS